MGCMLFLIFVLTYFTYYTTALLCFAPPGLEKNVCVKPGPMRSGYATYNITVLHNLDSGICCMYRKKWPHWIQTTRLGDLETVVKAVSLFTKSGARRYKKKWSMIQPYGAIVIHKMLLLSGMCIDPGIGNISPSVIDYIWILHFFIKTILNIV